MLSDSSECASILTKFSNQSTTLDISSCSGKKSRDTLDLCDLVLQSTENSTSNFQNSDIECSSQIAALVKSSLERFCGIMSGTENIDDANDFTSEELQECKKWKRRFSSINLNYSANMSIKQSKAQEQPIGIFSGEKDGYKLLSSSRSVSSKTFSTKDDSDDKGKFIRRINGLITRVESATLRNSPGEFRNRPTSAFLKLKRANSARQKIVPQQPTEKCLLNVQGKSMFPQESAESKNTRIFSAAKPRTIFSKSSFDSMNRDLTSTNFRESTPAYRPKRCMTAKFNPTRPISLHQRHQRPIASAPNFSVSLRNHSNSKMIISGRKVCVYASH